MYAKPRAFTSNAKYMQICTLKHVKVKSIWFIPAEYAHLEHLVQTPRDMHRYIDKACVNVKG